MFEIAAATALRSFQSLHQWLVLNFFISALDCGSLVLDPLTVVSFGRAPGMGLRSPSSA